MMAYQRGNMLANTERRRNIPVKEGAYSSFPPLRMIFGGDLPIAFIDRSRTLFYIVKQSGCPKDLPVLLRKPQIGRLLLQCLEYHAGMYGYTSLGMMQSVLGNQIHIPHPAELLYQ